MQLWKKIDYNHTGKISFSEIDTALNTMGGLMFHVS